MDNERSSDTPSSGSPAAADLARLISGENMELALHAVAKYSEIAFAQSQAPETARRALAQVAEALGGRAVSSAAAQAFARSMQIFAQHQAETISRVQLKTLESILKSSGERGRLHEEQIAFIEAITGPLSGPGAAKRAWLVHEDSTLDSALPDLMESLRHETVYVADATIPGGASDMRAALTDGQMRILAIAISILALMAMGGFASAGASTAMVQQWWSRLEAEHPSITGTAMLIGLLLYVPKQD